jgi:hypothetical protein
VYHCLRKNPDLLNVLRSQQGHRTRASVCDPAVLNFLRKSQVKSSAS